MDLRMGDNTRPYQNGKAMEVNRRVKAVGTQLSRTPGRAVPAITQYTVTPWRGCSTQYTLEGVHSTPWRDAMQKSRYVLVTGCKDSCSQCAANN